MARPFVEGAKAQLKRYIEAQAYCKHDPIGGVNQCWYELSSLFEHLATVVIYLEHCGVQLPDGQLYKDIRNHIRHDVREEFDKDEKAKADRATRLGLNSKLQLQVSFLNDGVRVGGSKIENTKISGFINSTEMLVFALLNGGKIETTQPSSEQ